MNSTEIENQPNKFHIKSWEIEILISGGAFFTLYQLSNSLLVLTTKLIAVSTSASPLIIVVGGIRMLSVYFAIHLSVRAFWLTLVLLQKIYPQGINIERLNLAEPFKSITTRFDLGQRIIFIDKLSGLIYSWAVIFLIIFIGIGLGLTLILLPSLILFNHPDVTKTIWMRTSVIVFRVSLLIFLLDTFFYGALRRSRFLSKFYYPIYLFWDTITLGFLWRPGLQLIFSNVKNKWKAAALVLLVTVLVGFMTGDEDDFIKLFDTRKNISEKYIFEEMRYLDKQKPDQSSGSFIQSDVITDGYLKVFVNFNPTDNKQVDSLKTVTKYFSQLVKLSIDDSVYLAPTWVGMNRVNGQKGIQTILDITHLEKQMHILKIHRTYDKEPLVIPFWKQ